MCKVKRLAECNKRVAITTTDRGVLFSSWYDASDDENIMYDHFRKEKGLAEKDIVSWTVHRDKRDSDTVYISDHAEKRLKERNNWNRKTALRMVKKVYDTGKRSSELTGYIKKSIKSLEKREPKLFIAYGEDVYIFDNNILVTVFPAKTNAFEKTSYEEREIMNEIRFTVA